MSVRMALAGSWPTPSGAERMPVDRCGVTVWDFSEGRVHTEWQATAHALVVHRSTAVHRPSDAVWLVSGVEHPRGMPLFSSTDGAR